MTKYNIVKSILFIGLLASTNLSIHAESLSKKSQNPIGDIISVPIEYWTYGKTDNGIETKALIMKPVYPVHLEKYTLINRFIIPILDVNYNNSENNNLNLGNNSIPSGANRTGLGNIQYQGFLTSKSPGEIIFGAGIAAEFPTHAGNLGTDKYSMGPSIVALTMPGKWVLGMLAQNIFDVAGPGDDDVNKFLFQYFINYNLDNGWYLTTAPTITADWEATSGNKWTVPVGGGIGKLHRFGKIPVDFKLQAYSNIEKPEGGSGWSTMFSVKFLFPK